MSFGHISSVSKNDDSSNTRSFAQAENYYVKAVA